MSKFTHIIQTIREDGARFTLLKIWRYMVIWSPLSQILRFFIPSFHEEQLRAFANLGYWPDVRNPRSFNEKVLHRAHYTNDQLYSLVQDKYLVRSYVAERIGEGVLTELYHVTDDPSTIPFDDLPDQFVVKITHGSGMNIIVPEKNDADFEEIKSQCYDWLNENDADFEEIQSQRYDWLKEEHGHSTHEDRYIRPRVIVEEYIQDEIRDIPLDFKFFVFAGEVKIIQVDVDRFSGHKQRFYTPGWESIEVKRGRPLADDIGRPPQLSEMISIAETLGEELDFVRVDLYNPVDGRIVFGELTMAPGAGRIGFEPVDFDFELGSHWPDNVTS